MPDGEFVINGQYIVVLEYHCVTLGEEHLAQTIHRDVSDTEQDGFPNLVVTLRVLSGISDSPPKN